MPIQVMCSLMDKTSPEGHLESTKKKLPIKREDRNQKQKKKETL